jgi:hypothetical protein
MVVGNSVGTWFGKKLEFWGLPVMVAVSLFIEYVVESWVCPDMVSEERRMGLCRLETTLIIHLRWHWLYRVLTRPRFVHSCSLKFDRLLT